MATYYYAEREDATITVNDFNATDSSISVDISHNGTPSIGYATIDDETKVPTFTKGAMPEGTPSNVRELIKKHKFALYLNAGTSETPDWVRVCKATEFTRSMNPTTEDYDYIADEHPTTEVTDYKPSESMSVKTIKGEKDFELFYELYKNRAIGPDAHRDILTVFIFDSVETEGDEIDDDDLDPDNP